MLNQIDIQDIVTIAKEAGNAIMQVYKQDFEVEYKQDNSPLTLADKKANDIIEDGLNQLLVNFPILSEEGKEIPYEDREHWEYFWLVDPLDGTKDYLAENGEFTVNIALIIDGKPTLGVVYAPALNELYAGIVGLEAWQLKHEQKTTLNKIKKSKDTCMAVSRFHNLSDTNIFSKNNNISKVVSMGSALKYARIALGEIDVYPRLVGSSEWDYCSGTSCA